MVSVGIIGASGYTGAELLRLAAQHPDFDVVYATGDSQAGVAAAALYPSLAGAYPGLVFEAFDVERARGLDLVFLGLPHEASMALAPRAGRPCRLRRRPLGRVPLEGPRPVPGVLRVRARPAGTAGRRGVRAAREVPPRAEGGRARRHARVLRHGRDVGPRAARGGRRDRAAGRDRRCRERRDRCRAASSATRTCSRRSTRTSRRTGC